MILSYHFIRKRIAQLLKRPISRERQFLSLEQADSILLIFKQENQEEAEACMAQLEAKGKKVKQFIYADAPMEKSDDPDRIGCSKKDLDIWAFPRKEIEQAFLSLKADILIDLIEDKDCFPIYYLELQRLYIALHTRIEQQTLLSQLLIFLINLSRYDYIITI